MKPKNRPSVPVDGHLLSEIVDHPEHFRLEAIRTQSGRLAVVVEAGAAFLRAQQLERERQMTYMAWADDAERREAAAEMRAARRQEGGYLGRFAPVGEMEPAQVPPLRGVVYKPRDEGDPTVGLLVLSNSTWNGYMPEVSAVPIGPADFLAPPHSPLVNVNGSKPAVVGMIGNVPIQDLGAPLLTLGGGDLRAVEEAFLDLFWIRNLLATPAQTPATSQGGRFPRWSHVYYGPRRGGQQKRWVVITEDSWNLATGGAVVVRTTSKTRHAGPGFPPVQRGHALACCGDVWGLGTGALDLVRVPAPPSLSTPDMIAVARGLLDVHGITP